MKKTEKAMAALLSSDTQIEAAAKCGLTPRALRGYLADPVFFAEYQRRKQQLISDAAQQLRASYQVAIRALRDIVESAASPEGARISAARALLEFGERFTATNDILTQLAELTELADKRRKG